MNFQSVTKPALLSKKYVREDAKSLIPAICFCSLHVLFLFPSAKETLGEGCQLPAQVVPEVAVSWAPPVTVRATA